MGLIVTKEVLHAAYEFLCTLPPFSKWNLPEADDVNFIVGRDPTLQGQWWFDKKKNRHNLLIVGRNVRSLPGLFSVLAHEMVHLYTRETNMHKGGEHGRAFVKLAKHISDLYGMDV